MTAVDKRAGDARTEALRTETLRTETLRAPRRCAAKIDPAPSNCTEMGFGSFESICNKTAFPLCLVVGSVDPKLDFARGIVPLCYARLVEIANTMIFQVGNAFVHFALLIVLLIIIFHVRSRYTAIGRREMLDFFYLCIGLVISTLVVDCGVSPHLLGSYAYFVAVQLGFAGSVCLCMLLNGLLCFQFWEDGLRTLVWLLRAALFGWFAVNFVVAIITFEGWGTSLNDRKTGAMFAISFLINAIIVFAYVVLQIVLVVFALRLYWLLGAILLGVFFFVVGQVITYAFSEQVCRGCSHYIDGTFFGLLCNLFAIMMIYKYWDMITVDELEFLVASVEHGVKTFGASDAKRSSGFF